jgi:hypothetical protein
MDPGPRRDDIQRDRKIDDNFRFSKKLTQLLARQTAAP